jgi:hypothetical protein
MKKCPWAWSLKLQVESEYADLLKYGESRCFDDDVLNEYWIKYRMVRSHRLLSLVLVAIGVGRQISKRK